MLSGAREAGCCREVAALHSDYLRQVPLYNLLYCIVFLHASHLFVVIFEVAVDVLSVAVLCLFTYTGKVPSLLHLCRLALRKMMGVTRRKRMRELPLPQQLTSYLSTLPLTFSEELFPDAERKRPSKSSRRHPKPVPQTSSVLQHLQQGAHI